MSKKPTDKQTQVTNVRSLRLRRAVILRQQEAGGMAPTIGAGDLVEFDTSIQRIVCDGIYLLDVYGRPKVRRVQSMLNGTFRVYEDQTQHVPEIVKERSIRVMGKAVKIWNGHCV